MRLTVRSLMAVVALVAGLLALSPSALALVERYPLHQNKACINLALVPLTVLALTAKERPRRASRVCIVCCLLLTVLWLLSPRPILLLRSPANDFPGTPDDEIWRPDGCIDALYEKHWLIGGRPRIFIERELGEDGLRAVPVAVSWYIVTSRDLLADLATALLALLFLSLPSSSRHAPAIRLGGATSLLVLRIWDWRMCLLNEVWLELCSAMPPSPGQAMSRACVLTRHSAGSR
jgi:hypothetical protein